MKLFINDLLVDVKRQPGLLPVSDFDSKLKQVSQLEPGKMAGKVLIEGAEPAHLAAVMKLLELRKLGKTASITMVPQDYKAIREWLKTEYRVVKAAGGLVLKRDKVLMIYRMGRWDLPKGKLEREEATMDGAVREVMEECSIQVSAEQKLCSTWHTFTDGGRRSIKKTTWYLMQCHDDSLMKPQLEEGIEDLRWMSPTELEKAVKSSYASIRHVVETYKQVLATAEVR